MGVSIEPIRPEHIDAFHRTVDIVARERKYLAFLEAPPLEQSRAFVLDNLAKGCPQFVALSGTDLVGWCDITRYPWPTRVHTGLLGMGVLPEFRGQGVGRALITAAMADAHRVGLTRIELTVHADNAPAIALYESVGFMQEGIKADGALIDDVFKDVILMAVVDRSGRM